MSAARRRRLGARKEWDYPFYPFKNAFRRTGETARATRSNGVLGGLPGRGQLFKWAGCRRRSGSAVQLDRFAWNRQLRERLNWTGNQTTCNYQVPWLGTAARRLGGTDRHAFGMSKVGGAWENKTKMFFRTGFSNPSVRDTRGGTWSAKASNTPSRPTGRADRVRLHGFRQTD